MGMSRKEAIKKMGCKEQECKHLDENGYYTFCKALNTEEMCVNKKS